MKTLHPVADRARLLAWLDGSLDACARDAFDLHLCACRRCRWQLRFDLGTAERPPKSGRGAATTARVLGHVRDAARRELVRCLRELVQCCLLARRTASDDLLAHGRAGDFDAVLGHAQTLARRLRGVGAPVDLSGLPTRRPSDGEALGETQQVLDVLDVVAGSSDWSDIARALVLRLDGRSAEALALTRRTLSACRHPRLVACAFANLCSLLLDEGLVEQALSTADEALSRDRDDLLALAVSLSCLETLGRRQAARRARERFGRLEHERPSLVARRFLGATRAQGEGVGAGLLAPSPDDDLRTSRSA